MTKMVIYFGISVGKRILDLRCIVVLRIFPRSSELPSSFLACMMYVTGHEKYNKLQMHGGRILLLEFHDESTQNSGLDAELCPQYKCTDNSQKIAIFRSLV